RADHGPRSSLQAGGAGFHPRAARGARHDDPPVHARHGRGGGARRADRAARCGQAGRARHAGGAEAAVRRRYDRGGVLRVHAAAAAGRRRAEPRGGHMRGAGAALRHELIGLAGVVERNWYLVKRYALWEVAWFAWTVANTLTIVFIAKGVEAGGGKLDVRRETTVLLIGAVMWSYLGILFEILTETVAWERWEGTIEYTFMAPLSRPVHLLGMGAFAVVYGLVRTALLFGAIAAFFDLSLANADVWAAFVVLAVASLSFLGIGMMTAVLPLISPEKGTQLGFIAQGALLVVAGVGALWGDLWPLLVIGIISVPVGLAVFHRGELYAKRHGKLTRSG